MAEDDNEYAYHCSECDLQVSESFNFCSRCGANIGAVEEEEEPSNVEDPTTAEQVIDRLEPPVPKTTVRGTEST
jgi:DNA-directed RNA polymerase subunit RPC12/RpoP